MLLYLLDPPLAIPIEKKKKKKNRLASKEHTPHFGDAAPATTCGQKPGLYANFLWVLGQWPPRHLKKWSEMLP